VSPARRSGRVAPWRLSTFGYDGDGGLGDRATVRRKEKTATSSLAAEYLSGESLPRVDGQRPWPHPGQATPWVTKLARLARSLPDARDIADELAAREVRLDLGGAV